MNWLDTFKFEKNTDNNPKLSFICFNNLINSQMAEVEETLNRMQTHKNVQGIVIVNSEGSIIRTTYQNEKK